MAEQNVAQTARRFGNTVFREIHKNSWLKWIPEETKKKKERVWAVFCIHDDVDAYLETYLDNKSAILHKPHWFISLNNTLHISPTICAHEQDFEFVITLNNEVVRLAAPSWEMMLDWVESLRAKLHELKILKPKENLYSKLPEAKIIPLLPTRDPTSPLPPPPTVPPALLPGVEPVTGTDRIAHQRRLRGISESSTCRIENSSTDNVTIVQVEDTQSNVFNFENTLSALNSTNEVLPTPVIQENNSYDRLFNLQPTPGPSNRLALQSGSIHSIQGQHQSCQSLLTLREHQVMQLQKEMEHPGGVRLLLRKKDCITSIALADAFNNVWVCGWKQKENPLLYNVVHIGDQLLTIEGISVRSVNDAQKILRSNNSVYVHIVVKRVPHGQVFILHREIEGQCLGIIQEGNTAIIADVKSDSVAAKQGLPARARTCDGLSLTNWVLTEINGRPLNLFFKENQIRDRLNSVGLDISIVVQPLDLVKQLKKQLKTLKNYKDYILQ